MEECIEALKIYLIPPLVNIVLEYLRVTFTFSMTDEEYKLQAEITPLQRRVKITYSSALTEEDYKIFTGKGWTIQKISLEGSSETRWMITQEIVSNLQECRDKLLLTAWEDPNYSNFTDLIMTVDLISPSGWYQTQTSHHGLSAFSMVTTFTSFLDNFANPFEDDTQGLWQKYHKKINPSKRTKWLVLFIRMF